MDEDLNKFLEEELERLILEEKLEELVHEPSIKELENILLSAKETERWSLLKRIALNHGYIYKDENVYRNDKDYLMRIRNKIIYLENITNEAYEGIKDTLERKERIANETKLIGYAASIGSSAAGGGILGYLLTQAGLPFWVMIPSIIIPTGVAMFDMLRESIRESKELTRINKELSPYQKNIFYDTAAIRKFNYKVYERAVKEKIEVLNQNN